MCDNDDAFTDAERSFLNLLENDITENPEILISVVRADIDEIRNLIGDVHVDIDDDELRYICES
ncbi:hypothetical protein AB4167_06645 [Vibrio sp. 10N.286.49.E11]|uniref:hypothetical protein n=1 Tax=Vibrio sp. 10N.286.49.E11 TaxID=3229703 RepID=UPI0035546958